MSAAEIAEAKRGDPPVDTAARFAPHAPDPPGPAGAGDRPAPHHPLQPAHRRGDRADRPQPPHHPPAALGRAVRHIRLDGPLSAAFAAFPARGHQRSRPCLGVPVRHAAVQCHPPASSPRPGGGVPDGGPCRAGLVGRHPHREALAGSTRSGRAACSARAPSCCWSPTGWTGHGVPRASRRTWTGCTAPARRLIWLNPLLRWDGFEPKSQGIRAMLPHVDEFRPVHNLASLRALVAASVAPGAARPMLESPEGKPHELTEVEDVLSLAAQWRAAGEQVALATVTETWGSSPRPAGSQMAVTKSGQDGRLGVRRLHRGRGRRRRRCRRSTPARRNCWISA